MGVVIVTGCFQYYQESKSSKIMESFKSMVPHVSTTSFINLFPPHSGTFYDSTTAGIDCTF